MECFEYKNYTSKYAMQNRNNGRGVQVKQPLKVLQLLYKHADFDVEKELKREIMKQLNNVNTIQSYLLCLNMSNL